MSVLLASEGKNMQLCLAQAHSSWRLLCFTWSYLRELLLPLLKLSSALFKPDVLLTTFVNTVVWAGCVIYFLWYFYTDRFPNILLVETSNSFASIISFIQGMHEAYLSICIASAPEGLLIELHQEIFLFPKENGSSARFVFRWLSG